MFVRINSRSIVSKESKAGKAFLAERAKETKATNALKVKALAQADAEKKALALAEAEALVAEAKDNAGVK